MPVGDAEEDAVVDASAVEVVDGVGVRVSAGVSLLLAVVDGDGDAEGVSVDDALGDCDRVRLSDPVADGDAPVDSVGVGLDVSLAVPDAALERD